MNTVMNHRVTKIRVIDVLDEKLFDFQRRVHSTRILSYNKMCSKNA
jgi:hypothetical protein